MYHIKIISIFILLLSSLYKDTVQAQDSLIVDKSLWRAGMSLVPAMYIHSATMKGFEGIPSCCPQYSSGNGFLGSMGFDFTYDLPYYGYAIQGRVDIKGSGGDLNATEIKTIDNGSITEGIIEHHLSTSLYSIGANVLGNYTFMPNISATVGFRFASFISSYFEQEERLLSPNNVTFNNGLRTRLQYNGQIPGMSSIEFGALFGARYTLPLNKSNSIRAIPELMYELPLTSIIQGDDHWNMHSIRFGVTVAYAFVQESDMSLPDIENPSINIPKIAIRGATKLQAPVNTSLTSLLQAPMKSVLYDSSGNILDNSIAVQKKVSRTMFSIINYVFFDSNSAVIPDRYHRIEKGTNDKYGVDQIKNDSTLGAYYEVLNVIGKRIKDRPGTNVTLIGTNSNSGSESQNLALSKSRAESVRDYFRDIWGIDEEKIKIEAKNLPDQPSKINTDYGDEENRRVEIITDNPEIFLPLKFIDTSSFTIVSDIKFATDRLDKNNLTRWQLRATIGNKVYTLQEGTTTIDDTLKVGVQRYVRDLENNDKVLYKVVSIDNDGLERILAETMVPVKQIISSKNRVEKYNLITFGYNSSNVNETNNFIIEDIKGNINDNSTLTIKGYTDQTGTAAYNRQLSLRRAEEISHYFQSNKIITKGVGFDEILYPLQFPEGRFYSRTVNIMVDTIEDSN